MPGPGAVLVGHGPSEPGLGAIVPGVDSEHPQRGPSVSHLGPSVVRACNAVHVPNDTGTHLESTKLPVSASSQVVPSGFHGDQRGK
jgi:hypothetical protein